MTQIRWGRVVLAGFLAELAVFAIVLPVRMLIGEWVFVNVSVPLAWFAMPLVFGAWVAKRAGSRHVLHGTLVGVVAALIYIVLTIGVSVPLMFWISHVLKIAGGACGGLLVARRAAPPAVSAAVS